MTQKELKKLLTYNPKTGIFVSNVNRGKRIKIGDALGVKKDGYIKIMINYKWYPAHRLAWLYIYGVSIRNLDHRNRKRDDNRIENLRKSTQQEQCTNRSKRKDNKSGVTGVSWNEKRKTWLSGIRVKGKYHHLGCFKKLDDAKKSREEAMKKFGFSETHGE